MTSASQCPTRAKEAAEKSVIGRKAIPQGLNRLQKKSALVAGKQYSGAKALIAVA